MQHKHECTHAPHINTVNQHKNLTHISNMHNITYIHTYIHTYTHVYTQ